ncbi:hypothetical protein ACWEPC_45345 [Nonomuraea sp. NPDC004297]
MPFVVSSHIHDQPDASRHASHRWRNLFTSMPPATAGARGTSTSALDLGGERAGPRAELDHHGVTALGDGGRHRAGQPG